MGIEETIFHSYISHGGIFKKDRDVLRPSYLPDSLPHRNEQISQIASILVTALKGGRPSNILIFGKTGTGKTAVVKFIGKEIEKIYKPSVFKVGEQSIKDKAAEKKQEQMYQKDNYNQVWSKVNWIYVHCEVVDTQYGVLAHIGNHFIDEWDKRIPFTGWPTEKVYNALKETIDNSERNRGITIVVLDEIDKLVYKSGDDVLFHLTSINEELKNSKLAIIAITNDTNFTLFLDTRVRSRLGEERLVFPPYNALQLQDILKQRAELAFEPNVLADGVIPMCAGIAAQEHGDARRALDLLRVAGELAERDKAVRVEEHYVTKAKNKIELDCQMEVIKTLPAQSKILLLGVICETKLGNTVLTTGEVYDYYRELCKNANLSVLTQRRIADLISELDMLGLINARIIYKGRGGRTREIKLSVPIDETIAVL
ncbi:MAG: ORC1-type DNA replication protein, partial [Thermoplasmata archaeon]